MLERVGRHRRMDRWPSGLWHGVNTRGALLGWVDAPRWFESSPVHRLDRERAARA
jgi:hypothetical protein